MILIAFNVVYNSGILTNDYAYHKHRLSKQHRKGLLTGYRLNTIGIEASI